ncbi:biopolymer transporter ExbD [Pedobacter rhodius]|uniref:Biopolymer transporter ExbD n=1 Tax=Pedobacter rhodius TaxID=3004098 RepID=A0ABT4KZ90_9SPHI|nr:biopolymer transporter ExbD [Pedobacter sp. SJ11]MCZ4224242.1 biopolymer transporter ExbD [Pedobacter sp. SJ11]
MANLEISNSSKAEKGRPKKAAPKVDLTAMVDLMFLLTTFFMLTTTLSELKAADISKPVPNDVKGPYPASRTMTILLGKNGQAAYYMGETEKAKLETCNLSQIESKITANKLVAAKRHANKPEKFMMVIIKPTKAATYKDFIDVIDEMKIAAIKSYAIDDENISAKEIDFMKLKGI